MDEKEQVKEYPYREDDEWANILTHGIGLILSIIGLGFLLYYPIVEAHSWKLISFAVFGATLVLLYGVSTLYHSTTHPKLRNFFRLLDHCAIYLLIAGSYTPITLVALQGTWGWVLFGSVWTLAFIGIALKCLFFGRFEKLSLCLYLIMGWMCVIAIEPLMNSLSFNSLWWISLGGFFYTVGVVFYVLDARRFYHAIWHVFVMGGSFCHYLAILFHI